MKTLRKKLKKIKICVKSCTVEVYTSSLIFGKKGQDNPNSDGRSRIKFLDEFLNKYKSIMFRKFYRSFWSCKVKLK